MGELYIGLMSGTSLDGIDASLIEISNNNTILPIAFEYTPYSDSIKSDIQNISLLTPPFSFEAFGQLDINLGQLYALAVNSLLKTAAKNRIDISAIGSHGQTIFHSPKLSNLHLENDSSAYSLQLGDPNIIAEQTGITTIADFRRRDIAAGGQGAPLVPAFHQALFSQFFDLNQQCFNVINIGGISNITHLSADKVFGFDIGPGNTFMDFWIKKNLNQNFDKNGLWAEQGQPIQRLINKLKHDPYFNQHPPKSTGKEYFSKQWLLAKIEDFQSSSPEDIQASLCLFTAETIAEAIKKHTPKNDMTLICGGGANNSFLVKCIQSKLDHPVYSTLEYGIDPNQVEAMAFAWLAKQTLHRLPGNIMEVTGAQSPVILGSIFPGKTS